MQAGYLYAAKQGYDVAVQFDGDGQHCAAEIEKLLQPLIRGEADLVIGSRFMQVGDYKAPFARRIGMRIFSLVLSAILQKRVMTRLVSGANTSWIFPVLSEDYPEVGL
jgi:hypothetical protein